MEIFPYPKNYISVSLNLTSAFNEKVQNFLNEEFLLRLLCTLCRNERLLRLLLLRLLLRCSQQVRDEGQIRGGGGRVQRVLLLLLLLLPLEARSDDVGERRLPTNKHN